MMPPPVILSADHIRAGNQRLPRRNPGRGKPPFSLGGSPQHAKMPNKLETQEWRLRWRNHDAPNCHSERRLRPRGDQRLPRRNLGWGEPSVSQDEVAGGTAAGRPRACASAGR